MANDNAGYKAACLAWLKVRYDAEIGDSLTLFVWVTPRTVRVEGFEIDFDRQQEFDPGAEPFICSKGLASRIP